MPVSYSAWNPRALLAPSTQPKNARVDLRRLARGGRKKGSSSFLSDMCFRSPSVPIFDLLRSGSARHSPQLRSPASEHGARQPGFGVWGLGFRVWDLRVGVWGVGFGVWCVGCGVWGLGFGI